MATERQKKILENLGEGKSLRKSMLDAGYSENYADNTKQIRETKTFQETFNRTITDDLITRATKQLVNYRQPVNCQFPASYSEEDVHAIMRKQGLRKNQYFYKRVKELKIVKGDAIEVEYWAVHGSKPSGLVVPKGVDIAMKGKGYYAPDQIAFTNTEGRDIGEVEIEHEIEELEKKLRVNFLKEAKNGSGQHDTGADKGETPNAQKGKIKKA
jgi:hypothetical protein